MCLQWESAKQQACKKLQGPVKELECNNSCFSVASSFAFAPLTESPKQATMSKTNTSVGSFKFYSVTRQGIQLAYTNTTVSLSKRSYISDSMSPFGHECHISLHQKNNKTFIWQQKLSWPLPEDDQIRKRSGAYFLALLFSGNLPFLSEKKKVH